MKKTYKVTATSLSRYTLDVEAENEEEAYNIAKNSDGGEFVPEEVCGVNGDWVIDFDLIEEVI